MKFAEDVIHSYHVSLQVDELVAMNNGIGCIFLNGM